MSSSEESVQAQLPNYPLSLARALAPWKRAATAHTVLPRVSARITGWQAEPQQRASYRDLVGSAAIMPLAFPQVPLMALHIDLLSQWSFPIRAMGLVHLGTVVEVVGDLPPDAPWDLRAWVSGERHVRSGLEFDLCGEVSVAGETRWRSTAVHISRSTSASGAEASGVPDLDSAGEWSTETEIRAEQGIGRAFGRLTGDVNPIHLHPLAARVFGFSAAIAHGWWTTGRIAASLGVDESRTGRRLAVAFRRPVYLPSTPVLRSRVGADGGQEFALFPAATGPLDERRARALVLGAVGG